MAYVIGKIALGLRADYLAIATLLISEIVISVIKHEDWLARGVKNVIGLKKPFEIFEEYLLDLNRTIDDSSSDNKDEIKSYLTSIGFITIKPEEYSFSDQLKMFSSAKYVVGLYGAAMMMLAFCKKNTKE